MGPWLQSMAQTHRREARTELWRLAQEILSLGLSVVLDFGLWARVERDEMRTVARGLGVSVELHYLEVPAEELWRRIEVRNSAPLWDNKPISRATSTSRWASSRLLMLRSWRCSTLLHVELLLFRQPDPHRTCHRIMRQFSQPELARDLNGRCPPERPSLIHLRVSRPCNCCLTWYLVIHEWRASAR